MSKIFILAGDMSRDPKEIAREIYQALQEAAMDARVEPSQRSLPFAYKTRAWTAEERAQLENGKIHGAFAGPDRSFPIAGEADVTDAWNLAGHADNPDGVRRSILRIAREYGWGAGLPKTALDWEKSNG